MDRRAVGKTMRAVSVVSGGSRDRNSPDKIGTLTMQWMAKFWARVRVLSVLALPTAMAIFMAAPVQARDASTWVRNDHAAVRLISAHQTLSAGGAIRLGLEFNLKPGWHIYWRAPGDAGIPPQVDWSGSDNFASAVIGWPLPERFTIFGLTTFVYGGNVILPITAVATRTGAAVKLRAKINYLACEKICIPYDADLALDLATGSGVEGAQAARIADFAARVPPRLEKGATDVPMSVTSAALVQGRTGLTLEVLTRYGTRAVSPDILVEGPRGLRFGVPRIERAEDGRSVLFRLPAAVIGESRSLPDRASLTITLIDGARGIEQAVSADTRAAVAGGAGLLVILALAVLGGLILNLMPCVLPVLSLKLLSVMGHGGGEARAVREGFLATAAGIVFSFWVLAAVVLGLKAAGASVGWGIQFQSPVFLGAMAAVVALFASNMFGLFEIPLPGFAGRLAATVPEGPGSRVGAFATGAFATLLATPCSAPFLGTAVGFALTHGTFEIFAVFTALGLGLAAPYLTIAMVPTLATRLPRPGRWMGRLRAVLGVALLGTAAWLVSVLWAVAGGYAALAAAGALAVLLALTLLRARAGRLDRKGHLVGAGGAIALIVVFAATAFLPALLSHPSIRPSVASGATGGAIPWRVFDKVALYNHVAEGRTVFVDVTAEWCVTCKVNKALVIERGAVARVLSTGKVIAMRADWTRPNAAISAYLASFGRFGIPFNVVYGPAAPQGIVLSELLSEDQVLAAFAEARLPKK
ncbi:MAG: suppressor for copper-sensitivity B [Alphaproteobacteria bacterium]|jgi:suppressor for copper-sensitivity B